MSRRILVTGSASGIGAALYALLREAGEKPIGLDRADADIICDLTDEQAIAPACKAIMAPLDGIAHVAGLPGTASADAILRVNTLAPIILTKKLGDKIKDSGSIVVVSSVTALRCDLAPETMDTALQGGPREVLKLGENSDGKSTYELSKALINRWALHQAGSFKSRRIRINTVSPGPVETPILKDFETSIGSDRIAAAGALTGRHGTPQEIATAIAFLLSDQAGWINGTDLKVDGGYHAFRTAEGAR
ncbi:SDR family oxidoreductase [Altererythrobacter lutimaris]|nr:SDR family oxidoreductase [Altererythrobacter lutimaris]